MAALQADAVIESWGTLIPNQAGRFEDIYKLTTQHINSVTKVPGNGPWTSITLQRKEVSGAGGILGGIIAGRRDRLIATWESYKVYVCSRVYGTDLDVSWNLTFEPGFMKILLAGTTGINLSSLNAFQVEDMRAFVTLIHRGVTTSVDIVMQEGGLDPTKVNKISKGFLGVS